MDTIGKILSLSLLTIFGSAAVTIYLIDSDFFSSFVYDEDSYYSEISDDYESATDVTLNTNVIIKPKVYYETKPPVETISSSTNKHMIWTSSYSKIDVDRYFPSEESERLASEKSVSHLEKKMLYWNNKYHQELRKTGNTENAVNSYRQYRKYRDALELRK